MTFKKNNPGCPCCLTGSLPHGSDTGGDCTCCVGELPTTWRVHLTSSTHVMSDLDCANDVAIDDTKDMVLEPNEPGLCPIWFTSFLHFQCCSGLYQRVLVKLWIACADNAAGGGIAVRWEFSFSMPTGNACVRTFDQQDSGDNICDAVISFDLPLPDHTAVGDVCTPACSGTSIIDDFHISITRVA